ncbi:MAG: hypothetical protein LC803_14530 [Acidobacteria bacterium]|nr:hypothetical protein [Acidobacteriota bacterium]
MGTLISIIASVAATWAFAHYYYRKQSQEQINPIPFIKGVHDAVLELNGMAIERQDAELQRGIKKLVVAMLYSRNRGINSIVTARLLLSMIDDLRKTESEDGLKTQLNEWGPNIERAMTRLGEACQEYDELMATVKEISGKNLEDMFTEKEIDQILVNPLNWKRKITD